MNFDFMGILGFVKSHFDSFFTGGITVLGFIITYYLTRKNFRDEIIKSKQAAANEIIRDLPYKICQMMNRLLQNEGEEKFSVSDFNDIISNILAYGSRAAIAITMHMQKIAYENANEPDKEKSWEQMAAYSLLITQIKYDLTSEIISPESWFYLKIKDYDTVKPSITHYINKIVKELGLNTEFKVEEVNTYGNKSSKR